MLYQIDFYLMHLQTTDKLLASRCSKCICFVTWIFRRKKVSGWHLEPGALESCILLKTLIFYAQTLLPAESRGGAHYWNFEAHPASLSKNRLSSTTCGEELHKIFKDWQNKKDFVKKHQKSSKKLSDLRFWPFLTFKWPQNSNLTLSAKNNLGVPKIFLS